MANILLDLITALGCAIIFGLICIVLAFTWWCIKIIGQIAKEANVKCSPVKTVQIEKSDATHAATSTDEKKPSTTK